MSIQNDNFGDMQQIMIDLALDGLVNGKQKETLYSWAKYKLHNSSSAIYLDVGTNKGNSAIIMASALKHQDPDVPAKVYTVDNYCKSKTPEADIETAKRNISAFDIDDLVSIHIADDMEFIGSLPDSSVDMVFDDSDHSYDATLNRLRAYLPKMNKTSLIVGHDFYIDGPSVVRAVGDFRKENEDIVSILTIDCGMFWMFCKLEAC